MGINERRERERQQRRNSIIDAAEKVFFTKGIDAAIMDEVAEVAELSKGTLYLYFKSKEELHFAINMRAANMLYHFFEKAVDKAVSGLQNVKNIGLAYIQFAKKQPDHFKALMYFENKETSDFYENNEDFIRHMKENDAMEIFTGVVKEGIRDGSIRNDIPVDIICQNLWAMASGVLLHLSTRKDKIPKHTENQILFEEMMNGFFNIVQNGLST